MGTPEQSGQQLNPQRIMQMAWGYAPPLIIESAVTHGMFDVLGSSDGALSAEEVARRTKTSPRGATMILNALVGLELLARDAQGRYGLTPESAAFLVSSKPAFQGGIFRHISSQLVPKWLELKEIVRTGKPARKVNAGQESAAFFEKFVEDIFPMSYGAAQVLGKSLGLAAASKPLKVLDLASGSGVWGIALAQQSPKVSVTAVDWEGVLPVTRRVAGKHGVAKQFNYLAGDIDSVDFGSGFHVATLGHILHSEGAERSRTLIRKTFAALAPGGTIAIAEFLADEGRTGPAASLLFAVNMLVNTDAGDTFTFNEIKRWLEEAGFVNARLLDAPGPSPLVLADRPK